MQLAINVQKRHMYILVAVLAAVFGALFVVGFGGADPTFHGHDSGELDITLTKLQAVVSSDFHNLGGTDANTDQQQLGTSGNSITLTNGGSVIAPDLSCSNCIGGTEIDESSLSGTASSLTAGIATTAGTCNWGTGDLCLGLLARVICGLATCSGGSCSGCGPGGSTHMIFQCTSGRISGIQAVDSVSGC